MAIRLYYKTIIPYSLSSYMADSRLGATHLAPNQHLRDKFGLIVFVISYMLEIVATLFNTR
jgi:hypothetical protein